MELPKVEPAFLKASDVPDFKTLKEYELCEALSKVINRENLLGVQRIGMLWRIYLKNTESRVKILANSVQLRNVSVNVFSNNPLRARLAEGETDQNIIKVTIKDFPLSKANSAIESYLINQGIKLKTKPEYAKARNELNELTEWLNGDRIIFVEKFDEPLPRKTWISGSSVRIFHRGQPSNTKRVCSNCHQEGHFKQQCTSGPCCVVCKGKNHSPGDKECPGTAKNPHKSVTTFAGKKDVLSNFYPCDVKVFGFIHKSSEHAFCYAHATQTGKDKVAERILQAGSAFQAKIEASALPYSPAWEEKKEDVMQQILLAKAKCCQEFHDKLMNTEGIFAESVPNDLFWSTGLSKEVTMVVKKSSWPGKNRMGKLLSTVKEAIFDSNSDG